MSDRRPGAGRLLRHQRGAAPGGILLRVLLALLLLTPLLVISQFPPTRIACDVDGDGDIDSDDITLFASARNQLASGADDPRDPDRDGRITVIDLRVCSQKCTRPNCANNLAPKADAGPDQTVPVLALVQMNGAASSDPDGNPLTFQWILVSKPATSLASLSSTTSINPTFTVDVPGTYVFRLVVHDGKLASSPDEVRISTENARPIARAGPGQSVKVGEKVLLNGAASSDADGDPLTFRWEFLERPAGSGAVLSASNAVTPSFVADLPGRYAAQLMVNDGKLDSVPSQVTITTVNTAPVANAGPDQRIHAGSEVKLNGAGSTDVDGDPLTFAWSITSRPEGSSATLSSPTSVTPTLLADRPGAYVIQLIVNDGKENSTPDTVTVTSENVAPTANAGPDQTVVLSALVLLEGCSSSDPDGDPLTFTWALTTRPAGSTAVISNPTTCNPSFTADRPGDYVAQLIVRDAFVSSVPDTVAISTSNSLPIADAGPDQVVDKGQVVQLNGCSSRDPDGSPLSFIWSFTTKPAESKVTLANPSSCNPTFTADQSGDYVAQLIVNDGTANSAPDTVMITVNDQAPVANDDAYATTQGAPLSITAPGILTNDTAAPGKALSAQLVSGPAPGHGLLGFAPSGAFTFTPSPGFVGTASFTYRASDATKQSNVATVTIAVTATNRPPVAVDDGYDIVAPPPAGTSVLYGVNAETHPATLYRIDKSTGMPATVGPIRDALGAPIGVGGDVGLAYSPDVDRLYLVDGGFSANRLMSVDPETGITEVIGTDLGVVAMDVGLAYDPFTKRLFMVTEPEESPRHLLYEINTQSGTATLLGTMMTMRGNVGLAFNWSNRKLYAVFGDSVTTNLYTIDVNTSTPTLVGSTGARHLTGLAYDPVSNALYGSDSESHLIYRIDPTTAVADLVGPVALNNLEGLAVQASFERKTVSTGLGVLANDSDPDGNTLTAKLVSGPANGAVLLRPSGEFEYVPNIGFSGTDTFTYRANDGVLDSNVATVRIEVKQANRPPAIVSKPVMSATIGSAYAYDVDALDPDIGDLVTFSLLEAPAGMTIDLETGLISWTPDSAQAGNHAVTVRAQDRAGLFAEQRFNIAVGVPNRPPEIISTPSFSYWTKLTPSGTPPLPRYAGSLHSYDEINDRLIVFGGQDGAVVPTNEAWVLTHASGLGGTPSWSKLEPSGTGPSPRAHMVSAYDFTANRLIVYGGCLDASCPQASDAWVLTNANGLGGTPEWLPLPASGNLGYGIGGYDPVANRLVVFGGLTAGVGSDSVETKVLIDANGVGDPRWITLSTTGAPPPRGHSQPGVYDPLSNTLIVFGGQSSAGSSANYNDVWILANANGLGGVPTWTQLHPSGIAPIARAHHTMVYDPNSNRLIVSGGYDGKENKRLNDTWVLTHANGQGGTPEWIKLTTAPQPAVGSTPSAGYAKASNRLVAALGIGTDELESVLNDVWVLSNASGLCTANQPCNYQAQATDPDVGDVITWQLTTGPPGMSISSTGLVQWTPTPAQIGTHSVTIRATDAGGLLATQDFTVTVAPVAVPDVVGLAPEWARALLGAADLKAGSELKIGGEVVLRFESPPTAQAWSFFQQNGATETGSFSLASNILVQDTNGIPGDTRAQYWFNDVDARLPYSLSARARVVSGGFVGAGIYWIGFDEVHVFWLNPTQLVRLSTSAGFDPVPQDNTIFRDYVLAGTPGSFFTLTVDGGPEHRMKPARAPQLFNNRTVQFGDPTITGGNARAEYTALSFFQPRVVAQNPPARSLVANQSNVDLTIQNGSSTQTVPNVVGMTQSDAEAAITAAELSIGSITAANHPTVPAGRVISQKPLAGIKVAKNHAVDIVVSLGPPAGAPTITSTPVVTAIANSPYAYDVEATDPSGDTLTYELIAAPTGMTINAANGLISWIPTPAQVGSHNVTVRVVDPGGLSGEQSFTIAVSPASPTNRPPVIISAPITVASIRAPYRYPVQAQDPDGDVLAYALTAAPAGMAIDPNSGLITWVANATHIGSHDVAFVASDGRGGNAVQAFKLEVPSGNSAPVITSSPVLNASESAEYTYQVQALDPDQDPLTFSMTTAPSGMVIDAATGAIRWVPGPTQVGGNAVRVRVTDNLGAFNEQSFNVVVGVNRPPIITSKAITAATQGAEYRYNVRAIDPDNDRVTFSLRMGQACLPPPSGLGAWITGDGVLRDRATDNIGRWLNTTPSYGRGMVGDAFSFQENRGDLLLFDHRPQYDILQNENFTIDAWINLQSPTPVAADWIISNYEQSNAIGGITRGRFVVSIDPDHYRVVFSLGESPDASYLLYSDREIPLREWIHLAVKREADRAYIYINGELDTYTDGKLAWDGQARVRVWSATAFQRYTDLVTTASLANKDPLIIGSVYDTRFGGTNTQPTHGFGGLIDEVELHHRALTADEIKAIYQVGPLGKCKTPAGLPNGLAFDADTGLIQWTPQAEQIGRYFATVEASDGRGGKDVQVFTLDVEAQPNRAPVITSVPPVNATVGEPYTYQLQANDADGHPIRYGLDLGDFTSLTDVAVADDGTLYAVDANAYGTGAIFRVDPATGAQRVISQGGHFVYPYSVAIEAGGTLIVSDRRAAGGAGALIRVNPASGQQSVISSGGNFVSPSGITVMPNGDILVADAGGRNPDPLGATGALIRVHPVTGAQHVLSSGGEFRFPVDVALGTSGEIYLLDRQVGYEGNAGGAVFRIDPTTGAQTLVSAKGFLLYPSGLAVRNDGSLLVTDLWGPWLGAVPASRPQPIVPTLVQINPATGAQQIGSFIGLLRDPMGLAVTNDGRVFVANIRGCARSVCSEVGSSIVLLSPDLKTEEIVAPRQIAGLAVDAISGRLTWTPSADQVGAHEIRLRASDDHGGSDRQTFTVAVGSAGNAPPSITSAPVTSANVGEAYSYTVTAVDPQGPAGLVFSLVAAPAGMTINPSTGAIAWTPSAGQIGSQSVRVRVTDPGGLFDEQPYTVTVSSAPPPNQPPSISSSAVTTAMVGAAYSYTVTATDPDGVSGLVFSLPTAPTGMTIDSSSGVISWTPTEPQIGPHDVTVRVTDPGGLAAVQSFMVTVVGVSPELVTVPNVVGQTTAAAQTAIDAAKLKVGTITTRDADEALGFTSLPSVQSWLYGAFGNSTPEASVFSVSGGVLTQNSLAAGDGLNMYQRPGVVNADQPFALTVRARVLEQAGDPTDPFGFAFGVTTSTEQIAIGLRTDGIYDANGNKLSVAIDTTQLHDYRLESTPKVGYRLFVDGVLVGSGTNRPRTTPTEPFLFLGDASATSNARAEVTALAFVQRPGQVIAQDPTGGTSVPVGSAVNLTAIKALETVTVPAVTSLPQSGAIAALVGAKLLVGTIGTQNHPSIPSGNVIAQSVAGGTTAVEFTVVNLTVSLGPTMVSVPNVVGQAQTLAESAIVSAGLSVGPITTQPSETVPAGTVISQTPAAGTAVLPGAAVSLVVSTGSSNPITAIVVTPVNPLVVTGDTVSFSAIGIRANGSSVPLTSGVTWSSSNTTAAGINPIGVASALAAGGTTITATSGTVSGSATLTIQPGTPNPTLPTAQITAPVDDATVTTAIPVVGTATDPEFLKYVLEIAQANTDNFTAIATGTSPVVNGTLGTLDPTLLVNDYYRLRLTVTDRGNNVQSTEIGIQVGREKKIGNFTLAFQDLSVPVAGLPITVVRTYDSRDKSRGDFGIGWRLDVNTIRLRVIGVEGQGWQQTQSGGVLDRRFTISPTTKHRVTITLPDGKVEEFDFTVSPTVQPLAPIRVVTPAYTPRGITRGTLRAVGAPATLETTGATGSIEFYEDLSELRLFQPQLFDYTTPEGTVIRITRAGVVQSISDRNGNVLTFTPGGIVHSSGGTPTKGISFSRDGEGRITSVTDPLDNVQTYAYDVNGDLASHTDVVGNRTEFLYNFSHGLIEIRDPRGIRPVRNEYDDTGRLVKHIDAFGKEIVYKHDIAANDEIITDRLGRQTIHRYDALGNVIRTIDAAGGVTNRTYDAAGNMLSETDPLNRTRTYTYDAQDNRLTETDALGKVTTYTYNTNRQVLTIRDALGRTTTNTYDGAGNLLSTTDADGNVTSYTYFPNGQQRTRTDPLGNVTSYEYDASGNLTKDIEPAGGKTTTYTYDANGNRLTQATTRTVGSGTETLTTAFEYDKLNRLTRTTHPDGSTTQVAYNAIGKQEKMIDPLSRETRLEYDAMGRLTKTTYPDSTSESSAYDAEGRRTASTDRGGRTTTYAYDVLGSLETTSYPDATTTRSVYNLAGQVTQSIDARGNITRYEYDAAGRRTKVTDALGKVTTFAYDDAGNQTSITDALGRTTSFTHDANNRRIWVTYPDKTFDTVTYDALGRQKTKTDQAGKTTTFDYDALGRLIRVTDALGGITQYTYDELGNQLTQTDAEGRTTRFAYDRMGRRTTRTLPLGQVETSAYDAAGNLVSKTDFNGRTTTYAYDTVNRLITKTPDAFFTLAPVRFTYTASGQRASMVDASGTTIYTYDSRDRLLIKATPQGTLTYTYDPAGNLASIQSSNANGVHLIYAYDALNRLETVTDQRIPEIGGGVTTYSYTDVGSLAGFVYPNGVETAYTYNALNRLTNVTGKKLTDLASFTYELSAAGNRTAVTEISGRRVVYSYDDLYRLTRERITGDPTLARNG